MLVGIGIFLFWYMAFPHAMSYQEQYQLFLWTGDYFMERVSLPGGVAGSLAAGLALRGFAATDGQTIAAVVVVVELDSSRDVVVADG